MVGQQVGAILGRGMARYGLRARRRILRDMDQRHITLAAGQLLRHDRVGVARGNHRNVEVWSTLRRLVDSHIALMDASGGGRFALPNESEYFRVHFIFQRRTHSVRCSGIDLERRTLDDLG